MDVLVCVCVVMALVLGWGCVGFVFVGLFRLVVWGFVILGWYKGCGFRLTCGVWGMLVCLGCGCDLWLRGLVGAGCLLVVWGWRVWL